MIKIHNKRWFLSRLTRIVVGLAITGASVQARAGDGTLPVRLPGDGTLPALVGEALNLGTNTGATQASVLFSHLRTEALPAGAPGPNCRTPGATRHAASGTVRVGTNTMPIQGVCFNPQTQEMEILATQHTASATVTGNIQNSLDLSRFQGRLLLNQGPATSRWRVDLRNTRTP